MLRPYQSKLSGFVIFQIQNTEAEKAIVCLRLTAVVSLWETCEHWQDGANLSLLTSYQKAPGTQTTEIQPMNLLA